MDGNSMDLLVTTSAVIIITIIVAFILFFKRVRKNKEHEMTKELNTQMVDKNNNENISYNYNKLTKATEMFLKDSLGNELIFKRPDLQNKLQKKYREVSISNANQISGHIVNSAMPFLQQAITLRQIAKAAPNGLYTTLVDPEKLSKFMDGSYTTMIRNAENELAGHQGFVPVADLVKANPIMVLNAGMQAMAMVSGQYYLHQINSQLESISEKLDELINYHHDEKIGLLLTVKDRLLKIVSKQYVDEHDIEEVRRLLKDTSNVYEEYHFRLDRKIKDLSDFESKAWWGKNRITALEEKIKEINFTVKVVYEAEQLCLQAECTEIAIRMKLGNKMEKIQELMKQMEEHYDNSFYAKVDTFNDKYKRIVIERYKKLGEKYLLKHPERLKQLTNLISLSEIKISDTNIGDLTQKLLEEQNKEQEFIYIPGDDLESQRIFVAVES